MKQPPYSYHEAKSLSGEYQNLIGLSYDATANKAIDMVVVTPYDQNSKNRFLMLFLMLNDADAALSLDYSGSQYDVMVISGSASTNSMVHTSLHDWHFANGKKEIEELCGEYTSAQDIAI
jgi:hypothetical protein